MLAETLEELGASIDKAHESLKRDLAKIRAGRANPGILDASGSTTTARRLR